MSMFRKVAATAAAVVCLAAFVSVRPATAADAPPAMSGLPELGAPATGAAPTLPSVSGAGKVAGGVSADRMAKTMKAAAAAAEPSIRGALEQDIYSKFSPAVVLIVREDGLGSGAIVGADGTIITNAHVVNGVKAVGVIFKPKSEGAHVYGSDAVQAAVVRVDQIADLALIKVAALPPGVTPLAVGDLAKLKVGADVHAIGHPFGEAWSYTRGIVSQIRRDYEWKSREEGIDHRADVVQTQTPTSPGSSGGPLLNDKGEIVGINAFGFPDAPQLNYAIAASDVRRFLTSNTDRLAPVTSAASTASGATAAPTAPAKAGKCEPVSLGDKRTKKNDATVGALDTDCNGKADMFIVVPDNKDEAITVLVDLNENGKFEAMYIDRNRDGKFDAVYFDTDEDGHVDLVGTDLDDNLQPAHVTLAGS